MKKNNNGLLLTILGGAIFCFVFLGMAFIYTNNTRTLKGNSKISNQFIDNDESISLGDTTTPCAESEDIYGSTCDGATTWVCGISSENCGTAGGNGSQECLSHGLNCSTCSLQKKSIKTGTKCTACNYGSYLNGDNCYKCHAGSYCGDGINETICPAGKYSEAEGQIACASCTELGPNKYQDQSGQTSCKTCDGVVQDGGTACAEGVDPICYGGEYLLDGQCEPCPKGKYCPDRVAAFDCGKGTYQDARGKSACISCANLGDNKYQDEYGQTSCKTCYGEVNQQRTSCTVQCGMRSTEEACGNTDCEWVDGACRNKLKACTSITDKTECQGRSDCDWDTAWTTYCHDKRELVSLVGGGEAYVTPDTCKKFTLVATGSNGHNPAASWSITGSHYTATCIGTSTSTCEVTVCGWACPPASATVKVTATYDGVSKDATIKINSYTKWSQSEWNKAPTDASSAYIYDSTALDHNVCVGYSDPYEENGVTKYKYKYNRCCGTPSACYVKTACYKKADNSYIWTDNPDTGWTEQTTITKKEDCNGTAVSESEYVNYTWTSSPATTWTKITSITTGTSCVKAPGCYIDDSGGYIWTNTPRPSWKLTNYTKESDCKETEDDACYIDTNGEYTWGKHAKDAGYTLVTSIKDSALCHNPVPEEACYKNGDDYIWTTSAPAGYEKVEGVSKPEDCGPEEVPACYVHGSEFVWGPYEKVTGYIKLEDIENKEDCELPSEEEACYIDSKGDYYWGDYSDNEEYEIVPSVTSKSQCKGEVPVPKTGISTSKIIYIVMAILMASGVGFIYYSSVVKKNN